MHRVNSNVYLNIIFTGNLRELHHCCARTEMCPPLVCRPNWMYGIRLFIHHTDIRVYAPLIYTNTVLIAPTHIGITYVILRKDYTKILKLGKIL